MDTFHFEKFLDETIGLARVSKKQNLFGFDLFNGAGKDSQEVAFLSIPLNYLAPRELNVSAFPFFALNFDETSENACFENGMPLSEYCEEFLNELPDSGEKGKVPFEEWKIQSVLDIFASVWQLLSQLESNGFSLKSFRSSEIICFANQNSWRILPTQNINRHYPSDFKSQSRFGQSQKHFLDWLNSLPITWPVTVEAIQKWGETNSLNMPGISKFLEDPAIWSARIPDEPFTSLKTERAKDQQLLHWSVPENASGTLQLFKMKANHSFPRHFPLFPKEILSEFTEYEIPIQSNPLSIPLTDNRFLRLVGVRSCGKWAKIGRIFRIGGPEDVTIFDAFWDEDSLVLDLDWPDSVQQAKIIISATDFPSAPMLPESKTVKSWWLSRTNPLTPKRIPRDLISDWKNIYVRIFGFADSEGKGVFSLAQNTKCRKKIPYEI